MGSHRLDYWRERTQLLRIARGLEPTRDFVHTERFVKIGQEMRKMEHLPTLPWPKDLFGNNATIETLMMSPKPLQDKCAWEECASLHHWNVTMTVRNEMGGWQTRYFCCASHKSLYVKKRGVV